MYSILDYQFWLSLIGFFVAVFISFYLPGFLLIRKIDSKMSITNFVLALCLGYILWTLQAYILGYLQLRWVSYIFLLLVAILAIPHRNELKKIFIYVTGRIRQNKSISVFIFVGVILQSLVMLGSGWMTSEGMRFLGPNSVDGLMHMAYIQEMMTTFPPREPGAATLELINYHYWMDLNIAELSRVWFIPAHHIFFHFIPLFLAVITSMATFLLMRLWTKSKMASACALFFLYFGGDAAYIFMLILQHKFGFYTPAIDNGITQFYNMPHAAAKMIFISGLIPLYNWIQSNQNKWGFLSVLFFAPLVGFKVYFGIFTALGFALIVCGRIIVSLIHLVRKYSFGKSCKKLFVKEYRTILLLILFGTIASIVYFPPNASSGGLAYYPLEWPKVFLGYQNLNMQEWWLRMQVYEAADNTRNIIIYNIFAALVGLICIHGTRLLGIIPHKDLFKLLGWQHMLFFLPGILLFQLLGLLTLQKAGSFNVFNFFVVSTTVMALFTAYLIYTLMRKKKIWATIVVIVVIVLTVPRAFYETATAASVIITNTGAIIPAEEIEALTYLRLHSSRDALVQSHPRNAHDHSTTYVAYFSDRNSYISGITMIESHGQNIKKLEYALSELFATKNVESFAKNAKAKNIKYLYLQKVQDQKLPFKFNSKYFVKRFENRNVIILEIKD